MAESCHEGLDHGIRSVRRVVKRFGGTLTVRSMSPRFETDHYRTPAGALVGLRVHTDACVTAFVQKSNYGVSTNGPYLESGCFEPPYGH
ncbi:putative SpoU family rRNA methylase [Streptomyces sp. LBL]|nr:putative SpoU family rRNA methylase [Streptomyces sp. LBL]